MKKLLILVIALVPFAILAGCASSEGAKDPDQEMVENMPDGYETPAEAAAKDEAMKDSGEGN